MTEKEQKGVEADINLRAEIWNAMCNIDGLKDELVGQYEQERQRRINKTPEGGNEDER